MTMETVEALFQIAFWVTVGAVAVLSFLQARKTLFQPIKTEVFKAQLEEMKRILGLFVGKGEVELRRDWGLDKAAYVNCMRMFDAYAGNFFDKVVERDDRPYNKHNCPQSLILGSSLKVADDHFKQDSQRVTAAHSEARDPRVRAALWGDYKHDEIHIPREFVERDKVLQSFLENPLVPGESVSQLSEFRDVLLANVNIIGEVLRECAKEMPEKYCNTQDLENASYDWVLNRISRRFRDLRPVAESLVAIIRSHYDVDALMKV